jgi:hypothetical protein
MRRRLVASWVVVLLTGCMANRTRGLALTLPPAPRSVLPAGLLGQKIAVSFDVQSAEIGGGHHEGLLQVRQPWIYGLSAEQKALLYGNAAQVAALAFSAELQNQGLVVDPAGAEFALSGTVKTVTLNTFGNGTVEGFGTAGNYWEAKVAFTDLRFSRGGKVIWQGEETAYAKLSPSPAKLDWTRLTLLVKSLNGVVKLQALTKATGPQAVFKAGKEYLYNFAGTYTLAETPTTPIDVAARLAAVEMLRKVDVLQPGRGSGVK